MEYSTGKHSISTQEQHDFLLLEAYYRNSAFVKTKAPQSKAFVSSDVYKERPDFEIG